MATLSSASNPIRLVRIEQKKGIESDLFKILNLS